MGKWNKECPSTTVEDLVHRGKSIVQSTLGYCDRNFKQEERGIYRLKRVARVWPALGPFDLK